MDRSSPVYDRSWIDLQPCAHSNHAYTRRAADAHARRTNSLHRGTLRRHGHALGLTASDLRSNKLLSLTRGAPRCRCQCRCQCRCRCRCRSLGAGTSSTHCTSACVLRDREGVGEHGNTRRTGTRGPQPSTEQRAQCVQYAGSRRYKRGLYTRVIPSVNMTRGLAWTLS